jgi:hypothetical protein
VSSSSPTSREPLNLATGVLRRSSGHSRSMAEVLAHYGVPYRIDEARGGVVSTHCPYCRGSADFHLGYLIERRMFRCWRCGFHLTIDVLTKLCRVDQSTARDLYQEIEGSIPSGSSAARVARDREVQAKVKVSRYRRPSDVGPIRANHRRYLEGRNFDPDRIEREWGVLGTGPVAYLDDGAGKQIDYRHRLLVPIRWDGEEVSFQARDVTGRSDLRYVSCPPAREVRSHKHILYGRQETWGDVGIVVEGVFDAWRFGPLACATFGVSYTAEQAVELARRFKRVAIVFDPEPAAQVQARKLAATLRLRLQVEPVVVDLGGGDPGEMSQDDANHLVCELTR